jgi:pyruvate dehydrogenase E1 component alpha subunit
LPENPLLPHRKLRELYTLMQQCRDLDAKAAKSQPVSLRKSLPAREAILAATTIHLLPGDLLSADLSDNTLPQLAPAPKTKKAPTGLFITTSPQPRLPLCAGAARALQASDAEALLLAFATAGAPNPGWTYALQWAQQAQLPLLLACTDASGGSSKTCSTAKSEPTLDLSSVSTFARKLKLPVMPVDGEDAVALYRVMQESALRARHGGGPAVIWAITTPGTSKPLPRSKQPLARLQKYMATRNISLPRS